MYLPKAVCSLHAHSHGHIHIHCMLGTANIPRAAKSVPLISQPPFPPGRGGLGFATHVVCVLAVLGSTPPFPDPS